MGYDPTPKPKGNVKPKAVLRVQQAIVKIGTLADFGSAHLNGNGGLCSSLLSL